MTAMTKTSGLCRVLSAQRGPTDKISCRTPCGVPAPRMPDSPCSSRARARVRSIGKIKRFLIVTIFVGRRLGRQPSALRTVVRPDVRLSIGQLVTAGRRPYFASRRYSVDRAIPRRRAAFVRFPSQSRTWARIAWRSASRRSPRDIQTIKREFAANKVAAISFRDPTDCEKVPDRVQISASTRAVVSAAIGALPGLRWSWE